MADPILKTNDNTAKPVDPVLKVVPPALQTQSRAKAAVGAV